MDNGWQPKPGDRVVRPRRIRQFHLQRTLGVLGLFSAGYGDVGSSIYYGLGLVAIVALGATPIALGIAGIIYIFNALTYAEGGAMIAEAGGSASFARRAFNDIVGFASGWALLLSYIVTMAISAYSIPPYLAYFWPVLKQPMIGTGVSIGIIALLMAINVIGVRESTRVNLFFIVIDIGTQIALVVAGIVLILIPHPEILSVHMFGPGNWPSTQNLIYSVAIAALCFTGVETVSQLGEETRLPSKRIPRAYLMMIVVVLIIFAGVSITALSSMTPQILGDPVNGWARDPVAGIAANLPMESLRAIFAPLVSVLAASILLVATNAGLLGISRLSFNLSAHKQFPGTLSKIHPTFRTPYVAIVTFSVIAVILLLPGLSSIESFFNNLGGLYVFGSLLCFAFAHLSILALRIREPDLPRPFKLGWNLKIMGKEIPLTVFLGLLSTSAIWIIVIVTQPYSRWAGIIWMVIGLVVFVVFRRRKRLPITHLPKAK
jgi:basic amino acid/polyamine antiporter, APA family